MHRSSKRLFGIGVPMAGIAAAVCGRTTMPVFAYLIVMVASLGAADAFRRAAGRLMSTRKVMGALIVAVLMIAAATAGLTYALPDAMLVLIAGGLFAAVRCTEELFASQGDLTSATLTDVLSFIALSAALLIPGNTPLYCCIAGAGALIVGGTIAAGFSRRELPQINAAILREVPAALIGTALYPGALFAAGWLLLDVNFADPALICGFFAGMILLELAKSAVRRSKFESSGLKIGVSVGILLISLAAVGVGCFWYQAELPMGVAAVLLAGACAMILYAPLDWESIIAAIIMLAAAALIAIGITPEHCSFPQEIFIGPAAGIALCVLMIRQWMQLARQARASRIRKRAMKRSRS